MQPGQQEDAGKVRLASDSEVAGHGGDTSGKRRTAAWLRGIRPLARGARERSWIYPAAITASASVLGFAASQAPRAAMIAGAGAGALFVLRERTAALIVALMMVLSFAVMPAARYSVAGWSLTLLMLLAATASARNVPALLGMPNWTWALSMILGALCMAATVAESPPVVHVATALGTVFVAYLGAGLARHLAMSDARLLSRDEEGLLPVTRDLLLGRLTDGMLHNLAQPLNVISMANGNIDYIVEHLDIDADNRRQLDERIERIASHTESTAEILALFRSLGRDAGPVADRHGRPDRPTVGRVIERAVAATRFTVRHHVEVVLQGVALDKPVPGRQGTLEILSVAALLSAFGALADEYKGSVVVRAELSPAHVVIAVACWDGEDLLRPCKVLDPATLWLVEQVAREGGGDFTCVPHGARPTELVLRLTRDDI